ncbi:hypothetical protein F5X99DRAFT_424817 [Biscogniauxia marginata]|nr:hypothetical protein F5X99DRAFT_424817 [Biscogniauxia marginata]
MANEGPQAANVPLQWPPQLRQAYCTRHFTETEIRMYFMLENCKFAEVISKLKKEAPKPKKSSKWPSAPTRIQPSRRAREKVITEKVETKKTTTKRRNAAQPDTGVDPDRTRAILTQCREILEMNCPWEAFSARLTSRVKRIATRIQDAKNEQKRPNGQADTPPYRNCPFAGELPLECRYCGWDSEVPQDLGLPRRLAPPAPMHSIESENIPIHQVGEFGGVTFAVDVCGDTETVMLLKLTGLMEILDEIQTGKRQSTASGDAAIREVDAAATASAERLAVDTTSTEVKPKKRGRPATSGNTDEGEKRAKTRNKRRKVG